ncbi:type II toxin-antitoxin system HipA family toxin [Aquabacterium sp. A7-Y]|uniref:type II toxin-antitoxin system HipA family toxin n=1 Tax=Aquabacterium sp. A7-Y TaxID=1349605 RepID=UPI00223DFE71|nr:type II toxin-antitoxin system HipA family toxin [Aquabacterium sp. A7-Y]MCW7541919.1 type II toxin-antitoxin system HipA family toxin [Aquabacterium sp. A7-Y]
MNELPEKVKLLNVRIAAALAGTLVRESQYVFTYGSAEAEQPAVSMLMPPSRTTWSDGDLFPSMDMNLPEGFLFQRIIELYPKRSITKMHLLALAGDNGIGRVGYAVGDAARKPSAVVSRQELLSSQAGGDFFQRLVSAYLWTGAGISGVQPKIMIPSRVSIPIPDLIVKSAGPQYPGLAANEFICLSAAAHAGIEVPRFDLSANGDILAIDRFDIGSAGQRLGFEDIAALMALRVHDRFSERKYQGSYEAITEVIRLFSAAPGEDLQRFFEQLAFSVMVRNGDAHLKNFGLLYTKDDDARLAPMFDVVTTTVYKYERPGGFEDVDRTMALKWRRGKKYASKAYPTTEELLAFGRELCGVPQPRGVVERIADAMVQALADAEKDSRVPRELLTLMREQWNIGLSYAQECKASKGFRAGMRP